MIINNIQLKNFRNHTSSAFSFEPKVNMVVGPNGRGKTNLLEGIFLLSGLKSFRASQKKELINHNSEAASITANCQSLGREHAIFMEFLLNGRTKSTINGINVSKDFPLSSLIRVVLFSPTDLNLILGPPQRRREYLDDCLSALRPKYKELLQRYKKILAQKMKFLKECDGVFHDVLLDYNRQLALYAAPIIEYRGIFVKNLNAKAGAVHSLISNRKEQLFIDYKTVSAVSDPFCGQKELVSTLESHFNSRLNAELAVKSCLSGIHRDDLEIYINQKPARLFASQGQARSAAIALRFAQRDIYFEDLNEHPIFLLDDVLSELDDYRRDFVCRNSLGGQTIISCCQKEEGFDGANVIEI